jgi:hypothetical protein
MRRWIPLAIAILIAVAAIGSTRPVIGVVRHSDLGSVCGCYFQRHGQTDSLKAVFFLPVSDDDDRAYMRIDGKDVALSSVGPEATWGDRVGDKGLFRFAGSGYDVQLRYVVTSVCPDDSEQCESTEMVGNIRVKSRNGTRTLEVQGGCGC